MAYPSCTLIKDGFIYGIDEFVGRFMHTGTIIKEFNLNTLRESICPLNIRPVQALEDVAVTLIRILMCIYNPGRIVIYHENMNPELSERIKSICTSELEQLMLPEIELKDSLKQDFNTGLVRLALEKLL